MISEALRAIGVAASASAVAGSRPVAIPHGPEAVLGALVERRHPFLLDSADPSHVDGRFSLVGCAPWGVYRARPGEAWVETVDGRADFDDPLDGLSQVLAALQGPPPPEPLPLAGGAVGFVGYDLGRSIERLPERTVDDLQTDELFFGLYDWVLVFDHTAAQWHLAATARHPEREPLEDLLDGVESRLSDWLASVEPAAPAPIIAPTVAECGFSRSGYLAALARAIEHIYAGDIYQVSLSQRFSVPVSVSPYALYRSLRQHTHAVFSAYLQGENMHVLSLSPERFLRVRGREVETCPIKGTRPRGATADEDAALAAELMASAKDAAELSMIVDLERNDLGRVCEAGTVRVTEHAALYTLETVHHTVTRVVGTLRADVDIAALLRATFPGGSITGAPKIRAMEIIESLEPTRRGAYTGSVGYLGFDGRLDLNIAIRTVTVTDGRAYVQAGGGIVADSSPEAEYDETLTKARALLSALGASI